MCFPFTENVQICYPCCTETFSSPYHDGPDASLPLPSPRCQHRLLQRHDSPQSIEAFWDWLISHRATPWIRLHGMPARLGTGASPVSQEREREPTTSTHLHPILKH